MRDDIGDTGCLGLIVLGVALVVAIATCNGAYEDGACHEAYKYAATNVDTLKLAALRGCELPKGATP